MAARPTSRSYPGSQSYDAAQRAFHWIMAALILLAIVIGVTTSFLPPRTSPRVELLTLHKSLGMSALVLGVLRIGYRAIVGAPPYAAALAASTRVASRAAHLALYALMIALPVSGYVNSAAGGHELSWFGLFAWPNFAPQDKALAHGASQAHYRLAWTIAAILALHLAAVAWHRWAKRDEIFARMWPDRAALAGQGGRA
ncbi:MAG TPA: cytochrome b [Roseiarcus sp.]|nr:cytochrome b [Roseiarcus sp.]